MATLDPFGSWGVVTDPYVPPEQGPQNALPTCCNPADTTTPGGGGGGGSFFNQAARIEKRCVGGNYFGAPACIAIDAGVFESLISQEDADAQATYAAGLVLGTVNPASCCVGDPTPATKLEDVVWDVTTGGLGTNHFTWDDATASGIADGSLAPTGDGSTTSSGIAWVATWCNPWAPYNLVVTIHWAATGTGSAPDPTPNYDQFRMYVGTDDGSLGVITTTVPPIGSTDPIVEYAFVDHKSVSLNCDWSVPTKSGTFVVTIPIVTLGQQKLIIEAGCAKLQGLSPATVAFTISDMHITPLTPPDQPEVDCALVISAPPAPFHYDDRPANDDFEDAELVAGGSGTVNGSNQYASLQTDEPANIAGGASYGSIWYKWVAPSTGTIHFDTLGSDFDTLLAAYSGTALDNLVKLDDDDDTVGVTSKVTFSAVSGITYYIRVAGFSYDSGNVVLNWYP